MPTCADSTGGTSSLPQRPRLSHSHRSNPLLRAAAVATIALAPVVGAHGQSAPIAAWSFNDGSGTTLADSSGSRDGDIDGATWVLGRYGEALSFDGNDTVTLG